MDWCVKDFENANHNPIGIINGDETKNILFKKVLCGKHYSIDASKSSDPDCEKINYEWWIYPEAGTYEKKVKIKKATLAKISIYIPENASGKDIHVVLTLRDNANPQLTSYHRIVLECEHN